MNRKQRAAFNRAVQNLVDAEVAFSWAGSLEPTEKDELRAKLLVARLRFKNALDRYTDPVVPLTKSE